MDEIVKKYVERILEVRDRHDDELSEEELRDIARDIGLTEEELQAIDRRVDDSAERAVGFMNHALWDDAIREWDDALTFAPSRLAYRVKLAQCHASRRRSGDAERARQLLDAVLERDPSNEAAFEILRTLHVKSQRSPMRFVALGAIAAVVLAMAIAFVLVLALLGQTGDRGTSDSPSIFHPPKETTFVAQKIGEYPLTISAPDGIEISVYNSQYDIYEDKSFYKLTANVTNSTDREISEMKGAFRYVLKDGNTVQSNIDVLASHETPMRPGDVHPFSELHQIANTTLESASLTVTIAKSTATTDYPPAPKVDLKWGDGIDRSRYKLEVFERSESLGTPSVIGAFHKVSWEFHNKGPSIKTLKVQVDYYDKSNKLITNKSFLVAYSGTSPIEPGQMRADNTIQKIDKGVEFDHYELTVIEIE